MANDGLSTENVSVAYIYAATRLTEAALSKADGAHETMAKVHAEPYKTILAAVRGKD